MTLNFYNQYASQYFSQTVNTQMREQYERFLPFIPKEGSILDLGCGSGRDSYYFKQKGYQIVAVDGSKELAKYASELLGQPVINQLFHEINFNNQFDGIWACASLLHIPENQMLDILKKMKKSLKSEGIIYISVKEGQGCLVEGERLFQYYSTEQLENTITQCRGLMVEALWKTIEVKELEHEVIWLNAIVKKHWNSITMGL